MRIDINLQVTAIEFTFTAFVEGVYLASRRLQHIKDLIKAVHPTVKFHYNFDIHAKYFLILDREDKNLTLIRKVEDNFREQLKHDFSFPGVYDSIACIDIDGNVVKTYAKVTPKELYEDPRPMRFVSLKIEAKRLDT